MINARERRKRRTTLEALLEELEITDTPQNLSTRSLFAKIHALREIISDLQERVPALGEIRDAIDEWTERIRHQVYVGLYGMPGAGKTTVVNMLLHNTLDVLPEHDLDGAATTHFLTEISHAHEFELTVRWTSLENRIKTRISYATQFLRWFKQLQDKRGKKEENNIWEEMIYIRATLVELYPDQLNRPLTTDPGNLDDLTSFAQQVEEMQSRAWPEDNDIVAKLSRGSTKWVFNSIEELRDKIHEVYFGDDKALIDSAVVRGPFDSIPEGVVLCDVPGTNDINQERTGIAENVIKTVDVLWIATPINTSAGDNRNVNNFLSKTRHCKKRVLLLTQADVRIGRGDPEERARCCKEETRKRLAELGHGTVETYAISAYEQEIFPDHRELRESLNIIGQSHKQIVKECTKKLFEVGQCVILAIQMLLRNVVPEPSSIEKNKQLDEIRHKISGLRFDLERELQYPRVMFSSEEAKQFLTKVVGRVGSYSCGYAYFARDLKRAISCRHLHKIFAEEIYEEFLESTCDRLQDNLKRIAKNSFEELISLLSQLCEDYNRNHDKTLVLTEDESTLPDQDFNLFQILMPTISKVIKRGEDVTGMEKAYDEAEDQCGSGYSTVVQAIFRKHLRVSDNFNGALNFKLRSAWEKYQFEWLCQIKRQLFAIVSRLKLDIWRFEMTRQNGADGPESINDNRLKHHLKRLRNLFPISDKN